jgi:hypothetical protein
MMCCVGVYIIHLQGEVRWINIQTPPNCKWEVGVESPLAGSGSRIAGIPG